MADANSTVCGIKNEGEHVGDVIGCLNEASQIFRGISAIAVAIKDQLKSDSPASKFSASNLADAIWRLALDAENTVDCQAGDIERNGIRHPNPFTVKEVNHD